MAGGPLAPTGVAKERAEQYQGRVTLYVIIACIVAAVGGSIFGYDIGISGTFRFFCQNIYRQDYLDCCSGVYFKEKICQHSSKNLP